MKKILLSALFLGSLVGCGHPLTIAALIWTLQSEEKKKHPAFQITTSSLQDGVVGETYTDTLTATGGKTPYSWSEVGTILGNYGLTLNPDGTITGTPSQSGTCSFTARVTDSASPPKTAEKTLSIAIYEELQITTTILPDGVVDEDYNESLAATGGKTPYSWSEVGDNLSAYGLTLNPDGTITGTPTQDGICAFTVEVTDSANPSQTASEALTITVHSAGTLVITTLILSDGVVGESYGPVELKAIGGTLPYSWSEVGSNLSSYGLTLNPDGTITGTPSQSGTCSFTARVTDSASQTTDKDLSITIYENLQITTTTLADGMVGLYYNESLTATGGKTPYSWSEVGDNLSAYGLTLNPDGTITGTPTQDGICAFTVEVTDSANPSQTASENLSITIAPPPPVADFSADPTYGTATPATPLTVNFTDLSTGGIDTWEWDFNNDNIVDSTEQNPSFDYNSPGWYTVKLTVTGPSGSDSEVKQMYILVANNIWYVDGVGGSDSNDGTSWVNAWKSIEYALSQASVYDIILVADATYNETNLNFAGKKICLKSANGATNCIIDSQKNGRVFAFSGGETAESILDGFTLQNGKVTDDNGGAILCENGSSPTIRNSVFQNNEAERVTSGGRGGAIFCNDSSPTITNCIFINNLATYYGGAVHCEGSSPTIINSTFSGNNATYGGALCCWTASNPTITNTIFNTNSANADGGAVYCKYNSTPKMVNCILVNNTSVYYGGAASCSNAGLDLTNCTVYNNRAEQRGGGIYCTTSSSITLDNTILWANSADVSGNQIHVNDTNSWIVLRCSDVPNSIQDPDRYGGLGINDINEYNCIHAVPEFVDVTNDDYHLQNISPCIDAGNNGYISGVDEDLDGNKRVVDGDGDGTATVDIGAYEYQP